MLIRMPSRRCALAVAPALAVTALVGVAGEGSAAGLPPSEVRDSFRLPGTLLVARDGDLWSVRADGTGWRRLAAKVTTAAWSPDRMRIAYSSYTSGDPDIWVMTAAGGAKQRITSGPAYDEDPTWSPDGKRLAYSSCAADFRGCGVATVRSTAPSGKATWILTGTEHPSAGACKGSASDAYLNPSWHPRLNRLALHHACRYADAPSKVLPLLVNASTGAVVSRVAGRLANPDWSADGRRLVWVDARDVEGATSVIRTSPTGASPVRITPWAGPGDFTNSADTPVWSPDGRWVAYAKAFSDAWVTNAAGTSRRLLFTNARPLDWRW